LSVDGFIPLVEVLSPLPSICDAAPVMTRRCTSFMCGSTTSNNRASTFSATSERPRY
jgi:hypothetical protein